jgi:hypothetical protein
MRFSNNFSNNTDPQTCRDANHTIIKWIHNNRAGAAPKFEPLVSSEYSDAPYVAYRWPPQLWRRKRERKRMSDKTMAVTANGSVACISKPNLQGKGVKCHHSLPGHVLGNTYFTRGVFCEKR